MAISIASNLNEIKESSIEQQKNKVSDFILIYNGMIVQL